MPRASFLCDDSAPTGVSPRLRKCRSMEAAETLHSVNTLTDGSLNVSCRCIDRIPNVFSVMGAVCIHVGL